MWIYANFQYQWKWDILNSLSKIEQSKTKNTTKQNLIDLKWIFRSYVCVILCKKLEIGKFLFNAAIYSIGINAYLDKWEREKQQ